MPNLNLDPVRYDTPPFNAVPDRDSLLLLDGKHPGWMKNWKQSLASRNTRNSFTLSICFYFFIFLSFLFSPSLLQEFDTNLCLLKRE